MDVVEIPVNKVHANPQDRKEFDKRQLDELAQSIKAHGLVQPIVVRDDGEGGYVIVAGERRFRATRMIGAKTIRAIVGEMDDAKASDVQLIENINRTDLDPFEEAEAYAKRMNDFDLDVDAVADRYGKPPSLVRKRLELLGLDDEFRKLVKAGDLGVAHAGEMARLDSNRQRAAFGAHRKAGGMTIWQFKAVCDQLYADQQQDSMFDPEDFLKVEEITKSAARTAMPGYHDMIFLIIDFADLLNPLVDELVSLGVPVEELSEIMDAAEQVRRTRVTGKKKMTKMYSARKAARKRRSGAAG